MLNVFLKLYMGVTLLATLTGCAVQVSLENIRSIIEPEVASPIRKEPDFLQGEAVAVPAGYQIRAVFGEISEKKAVPGYTIDGVFYE